jgi:hypothetical protein
LSAIKGKPVPSRQLVSDEQIKKSIAEIGVEATARRFNINARGLKKRKRSIELREGVAIKSPEFVLGTKHIIRGGHVEQLDKHQAVIQLGLQDGHVLIGSDAHYWPGIVPTAHTAFLEFSREFKPKAVILNGDEADFPSISRWAPIAWEKRPTVADEIENLKAMLGEIERVNPVAKDRKALVNPFSNHGARFETRLATVAPEYAKVFGVHLKDHLPNWRPCWLALINKDVAIKHRFKSGINAPRLNALWSGRSMFTGHLHAQSIQPLTDYAGTRWGVDVGTMAEAYGPQFYNYTEMNPLNWRSGFCLLTFVKGRMLMPELVWISGPGRVQFRGKEWTI